jgi:hypothetical protein
MKSIIKNEIHPLHVFLSIVQKKIVDFLRKTLLGLQALFTTLIKAFMT